MPPGSVLDRHPTPLSVMPTRLGRTGKCRVEPIERGWSICSRSDRSEENSPATMNDSARRVTRMRNAIAIVFAAIIRRLYDFYIPSTDWDYPIGHISMIGKTDANTLR